MKIRTSLLLLLLFSASISKGAFKEMHQVKMPFSPTIHVGTHTGDFKYFLCSTRSDMVMIDGTTGKLLWHINFEKEMRNKKFTNQFWNQNSNVILVYDEDSRKSIATKYFIDGKSGKLLWKSDKYVSDFGSYELSDGFTNYYDYETNGVLLPTKESVELTDVSTGRVIWSKAIELSGRARDFDCFIMNYYDLVKIITGKDSEFHLTTKDGKEVKDIEPYFNKQKYLADRKHAKMLQIPEKNMYVIMQGETSKLFKFLGADLPKWKMNFIAYDATTNKEIWRKQHLIVYAFNWLTYEPFVSFFYANDKIFVEHDPNLTTESGLTVLDIKTGERLWGCNYTTSEIKNVGLTKSMLTAFPAPQPIIDKGFVYVVDKIKNRLMCYNLENGTKIWESERFPDAQKIPTLICTDGVVILGHGAADEKNVRISQSKGSPIYKNEYQSKDNYGIIAYDAKTGKIIWSGKTIGKAAKDKFAFIAGIEYINGKLYCATNKNMFILDPKTGNVVSSLPIAGEKLGDVWGMIYFPDHKKVILNAKNGVIKIDPITAKIEGKVKTPNVSFSPASNYMNANCLFEDYAIFIDGNSVKMDFKKFASIDLLTMTIRGTEDAKLLFYSNPHFSDGADMFYKLDGSNLKFFSMK